jgi:hypothetical protein
VVLRRDFFYLWRAGMNFFTSYLIWLLFILPYGKNRGTIHLDSESKKDAKEEFVCPTNKKVGRLDIDAYFLRIDPESIVCSGEK